MVIAHQQLPDSTTRECEMGLQCWREILRIGSQRWLGKPSLYRNFPSLGAPLGFYVTQATSRLRRSTIQVLWLLEAGWARRGWCLSSILPPASCWCFLQKKLGITSMNRECHEGGNLLGSFRPISRAMSPWLVSKRCTKRTIADAIRKN